jgi:hypothetical protein
MGASLVALGLGLLVPLVLARALDAHTPTAHAFKFVLAGAALTIPAIVLELELIAVIQMLGLTLEQNRFVRAFAVSALLEEILRFVAIDHISRAKLCSDVRSFVWAAVWVSVGFAVIENSYVILRSSSDDAVGIATARIVLPTFIHVSCGVVLAGGHHRLGGFGPLSALGIVILFHGIYDWFALKNPTSYYPLIFLAFSGLLVCGELARRARIEDVRRRVQAYDPGPSS